MRRPGAFITLTTALAIAVPVAASAQAGTHFADQVPPPAPDYRDPAAWAARAGDPGASAVVAPGATPSARKPAVDVFYIYPTTYKSDTNWNQHVADAKLNAWTDGSVMRRQAGIFNACCRIIAPRYRQASSLNRHEERLQAIALAYTDVERAFDHYIAHENHGRPFILAGHSQGAWLASELLEKRVDGTSLSKQLVAAYIVGMGLAEGDFGRRFQHVPICELPTQTGCVIQWNAVLPSADLTALQKTYQRRFVETYGDLPGKETLCVNPLTFDRRKPFARAIASMGAIPGDPDAGPIRPLMAHGVAAQCDHGLLVVTPSPLLALKPLPGGVLHYHDFGLFYADVRRNALARAEAYMRRVPHQP